MIKLENFEVVGWEHAIRGMRNPMNSWDRMDTHYCNEYDMMCTDCPAKIHENDGGFYCGSHATLEYGDIVVIGPNDHELMMKLANGGPVHAKYRRMIDVYVDITAPLYWWKEFDTYKVGTVANSCSTMHKIHDKEFTLEDFSCEHLMRSYLGDGREANIEVYDGEMSPLDILDFIKDALNHYRKLFLETNDKKYWHQMIQLLPSSYNQKRTVKLNYEVLANIYKWRKNHKLDEWVEFCKWIEQMPYSEIITGELEGNDEGLA